MCHTVGYRDIRYHDISVRNRRVYALQKLPCFMFPKKGFPLHVFQLRFFLVMSGDKRILSRVVRKALKETLVFVNKTMQSLNPGDRDIFASKMGNINSVKDASGTVEVVDLTISDSESESSDDEQVRYSQNN
jgi:hypothetical protein